MEGRCLLPARGDGEVRRGHIRTCEVSDGIMAEDQVANTGRAHVTKSCGEDFVERR